LPSAVNRLLLILSQQLQGGKVAVVANKMSYLVTSKGQLISAFKKLEKHLIFIKKNIDMSFK